MYCNAAPKTSSTTLRSHSATLHSGHITRDKRKIKDFLKLPSATSFIRETLGANILKAAS
jgi:hypothetical protein